MFYHRLVCEKVFKDSQIPFEKLNRQIEPSKGNVAKIENDKLYEKGYDVSKLYFLEYIHEITKRIMILNCI